MHTVPLPWLRTGSIVCRHLHLDEQLWRLPCLRRYSCQWLMLSAASNPPVKLRTSGQRQASVLEKMPINLKVNRRQLASCTIIGWNASVKARFPPPAKPPLSCFRSIHSAAQTKEGNSDGATCEREPEGKGCYAKVEGGLVQIRSHWHLDPSHRLLDDLGICACDRAACPSESTKGPHRSVFGSTDR